MTSDNKFYLNLQHDIDAHGFSIIGVIDSPVFTYSIGLTPKFGFEIIIIGYPIKFAHQMFHLVYSSLMDGLEIIPGNTYGQWSNLPVKFEECNPANPKLFDWYAVQAEQYFGYKPRMLQMILPDRRGNFPDDPCFDRSFMDKYQPRLSMQVDGVEDIIAKMKG